MGVQEPIDSLSREEVRGLVIKSVADYLDVSPGGLSGGRVIENPLAITTIAVDMSDELLIDITDEEEAELEGLTIDQIVAFYCSRLHEAGRLCCD